MRIPFRRAALVALAFLTPAPAVANDDGFEFWLNPSVSFDLDSGTGVEIETSQRLRSQADGREDTFYARFWLHRNLSDNVTLSGAMERRINDPGSDETRLMQQLSTGHGILRTRLRLEQRFVDGSRLGLRLRPRLGVQVPLAGSDKLFAISNAELFLTLRSTSAGGDDGLTGLRTQIGAEYAVNDALSLSLTYLRQQDFADGARDEVGHAPLIGIELSF